MNSVMYVSIALIILVLAIGCIGVGIACSFAVSSFRDGDFPTALFFSLMAGVHLTISLGAIVELTNIYENERALYEIVKRTVYYE